MNRRDQLVEEAIFTKLLGAPVKFWTPGVSDWQPEVIIGDLVQYQRIAFINQLDSNSKASLLQQYRQPRAAQASAAASHRCPVAREREQEQRRREMNQLDPNVIIELKIKWRDELKVRIGGHAPLSQLRRELADITGVPPDSQSLWFNGKPLLEDTRDLLSLGLFDGCEIQMSIRVKGGGAKIALSAELFDPGWDFDFANVNDKGQSFQRGGKPYIRPCGWERKAINVKGVLFLFLNSQCFQYVFIVGCSRKF